MHAGDAAGMGLLCKLVINLASRPTGDDTLYALNKCGGGPRSGGKTVFTPPNMTEDVGVSLTEADALNSNTGDATDAHLHKGEACNYEIGESSVIPESKIDASTDEACVGGCTLSTTGCGSIIKVCEVSGSLYSDAPC